jgi:toxin secretion/phage lysis holin
VDKIDNTVKIVAGVIGSIVSILTGTFGLFFTVLIGLMFIDFISGVMAALVTNQGLQSAKGYKGMFKKVYTMLLIGAVFMLEISVIKTNGVITDGVSMAFIVIEFVSIVENGNKMGLKLGFLSKLIDTAKSKVSLFEGEKPEKKEEKI